MDAIGRRSAVQLVSSEARCLPSRPGLKDWSNQPTKNSNFHQPKFQVVMVGIGDSFPEVKVSHSLPKICAYGWHIHFPEGDWAQCLSTNQEGVPMIWSHLTQY